MSNATGKPATSDSRTALLTLVALLLGLALGLTVAASGSTEAARVVGWLEPIGTLWVNTIRMTVIPLIVSSLIVAVSSAGPRTVGRLGTRAFVVFLALLSAVAVISVLTAPPLFSMLAVDSAAAQSVRGGAEAIQRPELPSFAAWLVALVPVNPIKAAADGAILPLIVFTLAFSLALGRVAENVREPLVGFFGAVSQAMTTLVGWILTLAPIGVFALALPLATKLGAGIFGAVGFYLAAHSGILLLSTLFLYPCAVLLGRVSPGRFARAILPAQIVAVSTRSSMATLPTMLLAAQRGLALPQSVTSFALPLAVSTLRLNQPVSWVVAPLFLGKLYGIELDMTQIITLAVTALLVSFSVPGIPSAGLFMAAPFFATVGLPPEGIGVLIALDHVPDVFKTLVNVTGHLASVTILARGETATGG
ncbi:MAG: dicarboxylate/amino acid:cation symporter [Gemmatimonadaceae bacterium]|nr:dicarboxylate/amino acid:cation symporter [Gemmatimonadaceae bacterium]MDQ3517574.1 dicarboxylate/amino acid:cation symporter [Gemmatimonadota bacterium]